TGVQTCALPISTCRSARSHIRRLRSISALKSSRSADHENTKTRKHKKDRLADTLPADFGDALATAKPRLGRLASSVTYFRTIGSTNDVAASMPEGAVVIADAQAAGRGRRGHAWFSPPGRGLYVSIVLAPSKAVDPRRAM